MTGDQAALVGRVDCPECGLERERFEPTDAACPHCGRADLRFAVIPTAPEYPDALALALQEEIRGALVSVFRDCAVIDTAGFREWLEGNPYAECQPGLWFEIHRDGRCCDVYPIYTRPLSEGCAEMNGTLRAFSMLRGVDSVRMRYDPPRRPSGPVPVSPDLDWRPLR